MVREVKPTGETPGSRLAAATTQAEDVLRPWPARWWHAPQERDERPPNRDGKTRTVVISDIHIGTNTKTCWYQRAVHEPYLAAVLDYIVAHADGVDQPVTKLVVLGDLFDFWTYPPDQRPPMIDEIIAANERILGPDGKLSKAVHALRGNVIYLRGNHDIGVTQKDLDRLPLGDYRLPLIEDVIVDESGIVLTHGHLFTMFNAPDARYPGEVPIGHFVTRAIAYMLENMLSPDKTAADLPNQGSPYGFSIESFVPALLAEVAGPSITNLMLDYFAARCGLSEKTPILMQDGSSTTIREAKAKYDGLWDDWVGRYGGGIIGETIAAKAVKADYNGDYMAWFAQKTAWDHAARGAITGHTHVPKQGIENSSCLYVNCGFECPAVPDVAAGTGAFNFGVIDADGTPTLWCVVACDGTYCVGKSENATADKLVFAPFSDFSCYVTIANGTSEDVKKVTETAGNGYYVTRPPDTLWAGATARFWLQDLPGINGAEGGTTYASADGGKLPFVYGCPPWPFSNYASGGSSFVASSGNPPGALHPGNVVPPYGHPLFVDFRVDGDGGTGVGDWTPRSLLALAVDAAGFRYDPRQDIIYSKMYPLQRNFGYAYGYDAAALAMNAIIDCEPIFFDYAGKTWMIELWKGQYGLETGCEIGVYNRTIGSSSFLYSFLDATIGKRPNKRASMSYLSFRQIAYLLGITPSVDRATSASSMARAEKVPWPPPPTISLRRMFSFVTSRPMQINDPNPEHNLFFDCANDSELLLMSSTLYRNGQKIFSRGPERHWWLTGFKWGVLSEPEDLTMDVSIECLDAVMRSALVDALTVMGYQNVQTNGNTVTFRFDTPKTPQPRNDSPGLVSVVREANQQIVSGYNCLGLTSNDPNTVGDQAAARIRRAFAIYSGEFFATVIANLARLGGIDISSTIRALTEGFSIALDAAQQLVTNAGYTFAAWIGALQNFIKEALDFSCVIEISNRGSPYELIREEYGVVYGNWAVEPPERIAPGGVGRFWLKDPKPSIHGADGWARYSYLDSSGTRQDVRFDFDCPTGFSPNVARTSSGAFSFYTKSGAIASPWSARNTVFTGGHPLYVAFVWGNAPIPSDA